MANFITLLNSYATTLHFSRFVPWLVIAVHCVLLPFPSSQLFPQLQLGQRCPHATLLLLLLFFVSVIEKKKKKAQHILCIADRTEDQLLSFQDLLLDIMEKRFPAE